MGRKEDKIKEIEAVTEHLIPDVNEFLEVLNEKSRV